MTDNIFDKDADYDQHFRVYQGPELKSLRALLAYLPQMTQDQYAHHVGKNKNDFAQWVEDIHGPGSVSKLLRETHSKEELVTALTKKVEEYDLEGGGSTPITDDSEFEKVHDEYTTRNEGMLEKFDEIASRLKASIEDPIPEQVEQEIEKIQEQYAEIRARLSEIRRKGKDTLIASLMMRQFQPKLMYAKVTRERSDFEKIRILLEQIKAELDAAQDFKEPDVRAEVMHIAGLDKDEESL